LKLVWKFNLVLAGIFLLAYVASAIVAYSVLQSNAREEVLRTGRLMMEAASSARDYTTSHVKPLLETQLKYLFLPETVPAFAATEQFNELRKKHEDFGYKEATLNPTNPRDRASDWEADIVNRFRNSPTTPELYGERDTPTGRSLFVARPIQIKNPACLECHNTAETAPRTMVDVYGSSNGFGWKMKREDFPPAPELATAIAHVLAPGAEVEFLTDVEETFHLGVAELDAVPELERASVGMLDRHDTDFARKALRRGGTLYRAAFRRR